MIQIDILQADSVYATQKYAAAFLAYENCISKLRHAHTASINRDSLIAYLHLNTLKAARNRNFIYEFGKFRQSEENIPDVRKHQTHLLSLIADTSVHLPHNFIVEAYRVIGETYARFPSLKDSANIYYDKAIEYLYTQNTDAKLFTSVYVTYAREVLKGSVAYLDSLLYALNYLQKHHDDDTIYIEHIYHRISKAEVLTGRITRYLKTCDEAIDYMMLNEAENIHRLSEINFHAGRAARRAYDYARSEKYLRQSLIYLDTTSIVDYANSFLIKGELALMSSYNFNDNDPIKEINEYIDQVDKDITGHYNLRLRLRDLKLGLLQYEYDSLEFSKTMTEIIPLFNEKIEVRNMFRDTQHIDKFFNSMILYQSGYDQFDNMILTKNRFLNHNNINETILMSLARAELRLGRDSMANDLITKYAALPLNHVSSLSGKMTSLLEYVKLCAEHYSQNRVFIDTFYSRAMDIVDTAFSLITNTEAAGPSQLALRKYYKLLDIILKHDADDSYLQIADLFFINESLRGTHLLNEISINRAWHLQNKSIDLVDQRINLQEQRKALLKNLNTRRIKRDSLAAQIKTVQYELDDLDRVLLSDFNTNSISISREPLNGVLGLIPSDELLINYICTDEHVHIFAYNGNTYSRHSFSMGKIENEVRTLISANVDASSKQNKKSEKLLYQVLLKPVLEKFQSNIKRLVIYPDGLLHLIPFETFRIDDETILLNRYTVSYNLSNQQYFSSKKTKQSAKRSSLYAFAPKYSESNPNDEELFASNELNSLTRDGVYELPYAEQEADKISELWNGRLFVEDVASANNFRRNANRSDILHLALHAVIDNKDNRNSSLVFGLNTEEQVSYNELSALDLNSELIVVSSCNSGIGTPKLGSGVRSLARGFKVAGAKSVIMSLWRVPDESTSEIMIGFYKHLATGLRKDEALRQSKLDYLANVEDPALAHPYYWAGFVVFGDTRPLLPPRDYTWWYVLGGFILIGIGFFGYQRRQRSKSAV